MKYLDLTGTTSNSFKIGVGTNSTELRVIDGILHYRNYGDNYKPLLNEDANYVLSPLIWSAGTKYEVGNLVYYGGVLFQVILNHTSTSIFAQNNAYRKVLLPITNRMLSIIGNDKMNFFSESDT